MHPILPRFAVAALALAASAPTAAQTVGQISIGGGPLDFLGFFPAGLQTLRLAPSARQIFDIGTFAAPNCASVSADEGRGFTISGDAPLRSTFSVAGSRLQPDGNTSCFAAVGAAGFPASATTSFAASTYFGMHWGSIDEYNFLSFVDSSGNPVRLDYGRTEIGTILSGERLAELIGVPLYSSVFINVDFFGGSAVSATFASTNSAFEFDNLAVIHAAAPMASAVAAPATDVAAPEALALAGLGTGLLLARRAARR